MTLSEPQSALFDDQAAGEIIVDRDTLCTVLGVSATMLKKYTDQGMPKKSRGRYNLAACVQWLVNHFKTKTTGGGKVNDEKRQLVLAQTERYELENARLRRDLIDANEVAHTLNSIASTVSTNLDGLAARVANDLAAMDDPAQIERHLFDESRLTRNQIAQTLEAFATDQDQRLDPESTPET